VAARRQRNAFRGRPRREKVWTVQLIEGSVVVDITPVNVNLVDNTMWSTTNLAVDHATLIRIRGMLSVRRSAAIVGTWFANIRVVRQAEGLFDPSTIAAYQNEPVLWTAMGIFGSTDLAQPTTVIDVKAMRKINDDEIVIFSIGTKGLSGAEVTFSLLLRSLLMKGTS